MAFWIEHNLPSVKTLNRIVPNVDDAKRIRQILERTELPKVNRLELANEVLGTFGVEYIPRGDNERSPAIMYCDTGDTYGQTLMLVAGHFRVGDWGWYVERGNYE